MTFSQLVSKVKKIVAKDKPKYSKKQIQQWALEIYQRAVKL